VINSFGRLFGCHTCGTRRANVKYHADHMPPVRIAREENERMWAKIFGQKTIQRYYPQCETCSNTQGSLVKQNAKQLKTHFTSLRQYHLTGFWMVLFGAGGFFLRQERTNSNDTTTHQIPSSSSSSSSKEFQGTFVEAVATHATDALQASLLEVLREREKVLRAKRKVEKDAKERSAIDEELEAIRSKKIALKKQSKAYRSS